MWIQAILNFLGPAVMAFMNPDRCRAVIGMVAETMDFANDLQKSHSWDDIYDASMEYACDLYDKWDESEKYSDGVDKAVKETVFPFIFSFIFGGNK